MENASNGRVEPNGVPVQRLSKRKKSVAKECGFFTTDFSEIFTIGAQQEGQPVGRWLQKQICLVVAFLGVVSSS